MNFIKDKKLIIHNAEFDLSHLNNELFLCGNEKISNEVVDTLILAKEKFPGSQVSLDALCKRFRVDNSKRTQHNALLDCHLLSKVYINLIDQKEPKLNLQNNENFDKDQSNLNIEYYKKIIVPTDEEIKNHKKKIKESLKKNFF